MKISRRQAIRLVAAGISGAPLLRGQTGAVPAIAPGPFRGNRESLGEYRAPEWFRDAKFGIWAHWGPQSAPEYGDWYARNMYIEGHRQYKYHVEKYGHPSKFGFKDIIPTWKAEKFDPDYLMSLYKKAGAKYFVSMGVHHDNFDLWNSKHNRLERSEHGTGERHRRPLQESGARSAACASASASTSPSATTGSRPATAQTRTARSRACPTTARTRNTPVCTTKRTPRPRAPGSRRACR